MLHSDGLSDRARKERLAAAIAEKKKREERAFYEANLYEFVRAAWPFIESSEFQDSWALQALCEHLQAVTRGDIKRLLINFPPRCGKSNITTICWPAWVWAQSEESFVSGPGVQFLCGSYNHTLSLKHSNSSRRLLTSPFYQHYWGDRFDLRGDQNTKSQYDTDKGGTRIATSVGGSLIGIGGAIILVDDPHNTEAVESEADRETVMRWWKELSTTRLNDPKRSAIVVVMQRLHEQDVSGAILASTSQDWTHLMLPMRYEPDRHCVTVLKHDERGEPEITWEDPRRQTGQQLLWHERYGEKEVKALETELGPYMASGRLQQKPTPTGGGILKREWWQLWDAPKFPACSYVWGSADTAYTEKEENDPTGFTCWGLFLNGNQPSIILMDAWRKRLELHIPQQWTDVERGKAERLNRVLGWKRAAIAAHRVHGGPEPQCDPNNEPWRTYIETGALTADRWPTENYDLWKARTQDVWGLCEWLAHSCRRFKANDLLIEGKASGLTVAQELRRLHAREGWGIHTPTPEGDKVARAYSVQSTLSAGLVYAPDREWAELVIEETSVFPKGRYKDLTDSTTQAWKWVRERGLLLRPEERSALDEELAMTRPQSKPLYPT